jgi:tetratricopeptide (TPR) repeat protein
MSRTTFSVQERRRHWPAAIVASLLSAVLFGGTVRGEVLKREHQRWTEIIQLWDGQYLKIKQHTSDIEDSPLASSNSDPWQETTFTVGGKQYRWEGKYIPIAVQPDEKAVYIAVYDRETKDYDRPTRFRLYRSNSPTDWTEIAPKEFPKHLAIQNTWLREDDGILSDGTTSDQYDLVAKMDPSAPWFRRSLTAKLWGYLEDPKFNIEREPSEEFVKKFKAKWIRMPARDASEREKSAPRGKLTKLQRGSDFDATIANFSKTLQREPNDLMTLIGRGSTYALEGYYQKALADFNEVLRINPNDSYAYRGRGVVYRRMGDLDKGIADFSDSIRFAPEQATSSMSYGGRGLAYEMKGDHGRALADLDKAIQLYPKNSKAYYARGLVALHKGELSKAVADLNEAIRLNPADEEAYYGRSVAYEKQGKKAEAARDAEQAGRLGYKPE